MYLDAELTKEIIGAAIEVHRELGPGLLESAYEVCLCYELKLRGIPFACQLPLPVAFKGVNLDCGYRIDVCVQESVVVELKSVEKLTDLHRAQLLTYLRLSRMKVGLLLNFNVPVLKDGIVRIVL
jgi:GxxExxY protein